MPRTPLLLLLAIAIAIGTAPALGLHIPSKPPRTSLGRRDALHQAAAVGLGFLAVATPAPSNADVIRAPGRCANGEGDGCADLAGDNDLIQKLQRKSSEHKEANQREALNAYYMKNYPDVFAVSDKRMVKKVDGSYALFSTDEVAKMTKEGRLDIEYPMSKGGRIMDLTQKPVLVLKE